MEWVSDKWKIWSVVNADVKKKSGKGKVLYDHSTETVPRAFATTY